MARTLIGKISKTLGGEKNEGGLGFSKLNTKAKQTCYSILAKLSIIE